MLNLNKYHVNKKRIKISITLAVIFFAILVTSMVLIAINVNDSNSTVLKLISIFVMLILGFAIIFIVCEGIYANASENKFLLKLINAQSKNGVYEVKKIGESITTAKYRKSILIEAKKDDEIVFLYYCFSKKDEIVLKANKKYMFEIRDNFIISYSEAKDE